MKLLEKGFELSNKYYYNIHENTLNPQESY